MRKTAVYLGLFLLIGVIFSVSALPGNGSVIQTLLGQKQTQTEPQQQSDKGILGEMIAQVIATPTRTPTPTPTPTAIPTPTPIPKYTLSGVVFTDLDSDGVKDSAEAVNANITVTITGKTNTTLTTNASGAYSVTLDKEKYTLAISVPSGYKNTSTNPQTVDLNANKTVNMGIVPTYTLTGNIYTDTNLSQTQDTGEGGNGSVTVGVSGPTSATTTTDSSGNFTLNALPYGNYNVTIAVPGGYKATSSNPKAVSLTGNSSVSFGIAQVYNVTGALFLDNNRNAVDDTGDGNYTGGTITFTGPQTITARSGNDGTYTAQVFAGTYTATFTTPTGYEASTPTTVNLSVNSNQTASFGIIPLFTISGTMFEDKDENGSKGSKDAQESGVTVTITGAASRSVVSDQNGTFSFSGLYAGTYTLTYVLPPKKRSTTAASQSITFTSPTTAGPTSSGTTVSRSVDFGLVTLYNVIGKVFVDNNKNGLIDGGEPFFSNAKVTLTKNTPTVQNTDATGSYNFLNQGSGDYFIAMDTPTGYRSTTANALNFILSTDRTINFGITQSTVVNVGGECTAAGVDIMIAMDDSGSMASTVPSTGTTKLLAAKRAATSFVDIISANVENATYSLVTFAQGSGFPNSPYTRVFQSMTRSAADMKDSIASIPDDGSGTCVECGIFLANQELAKSTRGAQKVVIIITDGATNEIRGGGTTVDAAENAAMTAAINGVNGQNIIYQVIGIGEGGGDFDPVFMQQLADTNGGSFYNSGSTNNLEAIYQSIAQEIGTGNVSGTVFHDKNQNKAYDAGDTPLPKWKIEAKDPTDPSTAISGWSDYNGKYSITGLCSNRYNIQQVIQPGWYQTTDNTMYDLNVLSGNMYSNNDFGNAQGFTISGNIVNDFNRDRNYAAPDTLITQQSFIYLTGPSKQTIETTNGTYLSNTLAPGTYTVSLISPLTSGYRMTYPLNGPPPSFQVTTGTSCTVNGAIGASCK